METATVILGKPVPPALRTANVQQTAHAHHLKSAAMRFALPLHVPRTLTAVLTHARFTLVIIQEPALLLVPPRI